MGAYGFLLRQYFDIEHKRLTKAEWKLQLDGVEIFEPYRNPVWEYAYDHVMIGDIRTMRFEKNSYDLALCIEVLEHLTIEDASNVVTRLLDVAGTVIVTSPKGYYPQAAWRGNEAEKHLSIIEGKNLPGLAAVKTLGVCNCYICSRDLELRARLRDASYYCPTSRPESIPLLSIKVRKVFRRLRNFGLARRSHNVKSDFAS